MAPRTIADAARQADKQRTLKNTGGPSPRKGPRPPSPPAPTNPSMQAFRAMIKEELGKQAKEKKPAAAATAAVQPVPQGQQDAHIGPPDAVSAAAERDKL